MKKEHDSHTLNWFLCMTRYLWPMMCFFSRRESGPQERNDTKPHAEWSSG